MRNLYAPLVLLTTTLHAQEWQDISPGTPFEFEAVLVDDAEHFLISGDASYRTVDGGTSWQPITGLGDGVRAFLRLDGSTILGAGEGVVMRSMDNGDTWSTVITPATDDLHALARSGNMVVAVGRDGNIIRSNDLGMTWTAQTSGTSERLFTVAVRSGTELLAGGAGGTFLRSDNGGSTWTPQTMPASDDWVDLHFFSGTPDTGILLGETGTILRTTDGGASWTEVPPGITAEFGGLASAHDSVIFASATQGRVLKSTDQGLTWSISSSPLTEFLTNIATGDGEVVAVGELGGVIKLAGDAMGITERAAASFTVAPNPASDRIEVLDLPAIDRTCRVEMIGADGRMWGRHVLSRSIDITSLPAGAYLLRITQGTEALGQRWFVVQR